MILQVSFLVIFALLPIKAQWPASLAEICVVPTTFPIRPHTTCADTGSSSSSCNAAIISMQGQIGETESIQILLRKGVDLVDDPIGGVKNVNISINGFNQNTTSIVSSIEVYKVGYVFLRHSPRYAGSGGGWRPDPLLPLDIDNTLFDVPPSTSQGIWVSFTISYDAQPGVYEGSISISCDDNKCGSVNSKDSFVVPISVHVWDIKLPTLYESNICFVKEI